MTNEQTSVSKPLISQYRLDTSDPLYGSSSAPIDAPISKFVTVKPVSNTVSIDPVDGTGPTPLGQVGINSPTPKIEVETKNNVIDPNEDKQKCLFPSSVSVAIIVLVVVIAVLIIYMYIQPVERSLAFANNLELEEIELNDDRLQRLNLGLIISLTLFSLTLFSVALSIEEPAKLGGRQSRFIPNRSPNIINSIQSDIYIVIFNILLFMMAIMAIVYYNNVLFTLIFALAAVSLLLFWRPNVMFLLLAIFEVLILVVFGLKFTIPNK